MCLRGHGESTEIFSEFLNVAYDKVSFVLPNDALFVFLAPVADWEISYKDD